MTPAQEAALRAVSQYHEGMATKWASASNLSVSPRVMGTLYRAGLVNAVWQECRPIGQRAYRYRLYQINKRGIELLKSQPNRGEGK